jgi:hypothetical protein
MQGVPDHHEKEPGMTDPPRDPQAGEDTEMTASRGSPPRMPRWVKWLAIVLGILVLLFVLLMLTGLGGQHGPGRHLSGGDAPTTSVTMVYPPSAGGSR